MINEINRQLFLVIGLVLIFTGIGCSDINSDTEINSKSKTVLPISANNKGKGVLAEYNRINLRTTSKLVSIGKQKVSNNPVKVSKKDKFIEIIGYGIDDKNKSLSKFTYITLDGVVHKCENNIKSRVAKNKLGIKYHNAGFKKIFRTASLRKGKHQIKIINSNNSGSGIYLPSQTYTFIVE